MRSVWVRSNFSVRAAVRIILSHEKWPTEADPSSGPAIYAGATEAVQPPDDRTYSAEVTSFPSNLPHHRNALFCVFRKIRRFPLHALHYYTTPKTICQALFFKNSEQITKSSRHFCQFGKAPPAWAFRDFQIACFIDFCIFSSPETTKAPKP